MQVGEPSNRLKIEPSGESFYPSETISKISKIIKAKYDKPWLEWNEIPSEVQSSWFEDFKKYCVWDEAHEDEIVRIWKRKSAQIIRQSLSDIRRKKSSGVWLTPKTLEAMRERWNNDPAFIEISTRNKMNALSNSEGRVHRGGAISMDERIRRYAKENDRDVSDVSVAEVFQTINFDKENDKWFSSGSEVVYESFKKRKEEALSQGRNVDDSILFYEATGGKNRQGRAYGFGSTAKLYEDGSTNTSKASGTQSNTTQVETLIDRVDQLEQVNARLVETNARLVNDVAEMRTLFENLQGQLVTSSSLGRNLTSTNHVGENLGGDASGGINGDGVDDHDGYGFD